MCDLGPGVENYLSGIKLRAHKKTWVLLIIGGESMAIQ